MSRTALNSTSASCQRRSRKYAIPRASRIEALSGSSFLAFSRGTVACAAIPFFSRLRPSWKRSYASVIEKSLHLVEDRRRDRRLRRLRDCPIPEPRDQDDLVVGALEGDVRARHIVVDDEVGVLRLEHPALPLEPLRAQLGAEGDDELAGPLRLPEAAGDVDGGLELDRPPLVAFRPFPRERDR